MAASRLHLFMCMVLCASNLIILTTSRSFPSYNYINGYQIPLFVFGDSFYESGNNNYLNPAIGYANVFPYGRTFFNYSSGRVTDGRNMVDYIAAYLQLPLIQPDQLPGYHRFSDGVNFASGAAGALDETNKGLVISLNTQLQHFKEVKKTLNQRIGNGKTKSLLNNALFMFSIGTVDYQNLFTANTFVPSANEELTDIVIRNITTVLREIYNMGGRRFGVLNLLPMGCTPLLRAVAHNRNETGCLDEANTIAQLHNAKLSTALRKLQPQLKGFEYSIFDFYSTIWQRMRNPSKYGFKEGDTLACCGSGVYRGMLNCGKSGSEWCENPSDYMFFDSVHPTDKTYSQLAQLMWSGNSRVANPQNLKKMLKIVN